MNAAPRIRENGPVNYAKLPQGPPVTVPFDCALRLLFPWYSSPRYAPYPGFYAAALAFFRGQVQYATLRKWRTGERNPPQWARDMLAARLEQDAQECWRIAAELRANKKSGT